GPRARGVGRGRGGASMKVLVAEDDAITRRVLVSLLRRWSYDVVAVADGEAAWNILSGPDAAERAVPGWEGPRLVGVDVCRRGPARGAGLARGPLQAGQRHVRPRGGRHRARGDREAHRGGAARRRPRGTDRRRGVPRGAPRLRRRRRGRGRGARAGDGRARAG